MGKSAKPAAKDAKDRLLQAAIRIFALYGFEGASTRLLAKEAGVNISAIPYYFSGKEGLYRAVIEHIGATARLAMAEKGAHIKTSLESGRLSKPEAQKMLHGFISHFIRFLLSDKATPFIARILIREQMDPTPAFDLLYEGTMRPTHEILTRLVAYLTNLPPSSEQAILCAHTILGQAVVFKTHKEAALRRLKWKAYGKNEAEKIVDIILKQTDAIISVNSQQAGVR